MKENPTASPSDEDEADLAAELALIVTYIRSKQKDKFYGVIELTFNNGEFKISRETRSRPIGSLATDIWSQIPVKAREPLKKKLKEHKGFVVD